MDILVAPNEGQGNPWQKRQLNIDAPKEQKMNPNLTFEEGGKGGAIPGRPLNPSYDSTMYPSQTGPDFGS
jgi:hypothetical protein